MARRQQRNDRVWVWAGYGQGMDRCMALRQADMSDAGRQGNRSNGARAQGHSTVMVYSRHPATQPAALCNQGVCVRGSVSGVGSAGGSDWSWSGWPVQVARAEFPSLEALFYALYEIQFIYFGISVWILGSACMADITAAQKTHSAGQHKGSCTLNVCYIRVPTQGLCALNLCYVHV